MEMAKSIEKHSKPTASQEAKFPNCPVARESEIFPESNIEEFSSSSSPDFTPSEPTGIVVLPLPDSPSSVSFSEDQNPNDLCAEQSTVAESKEETEAARVSEVGSDYERGEEELDCDTLALGETEVGVVGSADCGGEQIVGLLSSDDAVNGNHELRRNMEDIGASPRVAKKAKQSDTSGGVESSGKRIDEFRCAPSVVDGVECQGEKLPPSLEKEKEKVEVESSEEKNVLIDFLERLADAAKDAGYDIDGDLIATAEEMGMKFPRPRWWPAEGE